MIKGLAHYLHILLILIPACAYAQTQDVKFAIINGLNGVFVGKVNSITQDPQGVMWFSDQTNRCITQYDGARMIRHQHDPKDSNTLGGFYPECIYADSNGLIWIGFYGFGLDRFDPVTDTYTHYRHDPTNPNSISNDTVTAILIDHLKNIWVATYGGLDLFDASSGTFTHYAHDPSAPNSLSHNRIRALYEDHQGNLWVGTGLAWDMNDKGGLNLLDRTSGTFTRYLHDPKNKNSLFNNKVRAIFEDSKGTLWVGTLGDGLHSLDRLTGLITRHPYNPAQPEGLSRPPVKTPFDHITFITEDAEGYLWIGTLANGISRYNPETKKSKHYSLGTAAGEGFNDESGWTAYASSDGWLWISTQEANLYKVDLYVTRVQLDNSIGSGIMGILQENPEVLWFGTDRGLFKKHVPSGAVKRYRHDPQNLNSLSNNFVRNLHIDPEGTLWLATLGGLNKFDPKTETFTRYIFDQSNQTSIGSNDVSVLQTHQDGQFWIGTYGGGLHLMDKEKGTFKRFTFNAADSTTLSGDIITTLLEDGPDFWVGTWDTKGLNRMDRQTKQCKRYLQGYNIVSVIKDRRGDLWVGTQNFIFKFNTAADTFEMVEFGGISFTFNEMQSMILDKQDNIWMASYSGIIRINSKRDQYIVYGKENNFNLETISYNTAKLLDDGTIMTGSYDGFYSFHPDHFKIPKGKQKLYFTHFYVKGKEIHPKPGGLLTQNINETNEIVLSHDQHVFSFSFISIDYSPNESKTVSYKLENYDQEWLQAGADGQIYYFNVPPGKYNLRVNSSNSRFGSIVEKSITIVITPPWWKSWWAYILYALCLIGIGLGVHRMLKAQVLKAEREKNRAHELAQAREIEKAYNQLKNTQAQLIQSEKMASLGELTAGIAHEIQNPLNFINNFAEVNAELIDELNEGIENNNLIEVKSISKHIRDNEEKIIFHGKRADAIVKGMLQHSRSSSGVKEPTDINALADEYLRLAYHGLRAKDKSFNATMKTDYDETIGMVNVIPQDIGRVILNLITNAFYAVSEKQKALQTSYPLKGGPDYQPTVMVMTKQQLPLSGGRGSDRARVTISVSDNGPGITKSAMDKIFQPFYTTKPTGQGTGLGLSLSYDIVKAHGGELKVETKEGEGTVFSIQLPIEI